MNGVANDKQPARAGSNVWKQLLALVFAAALLWLAFRGRDFGHLWSYARTINPVYLVLLCITAILSHILRAWRWIYLLKPLSDKKVSLWNSFCAVMYGYAVNIAIPRGGELVRLLSICKSENLPWAGVLPTMFIDRLLDLAMLGILFGFTLTVLPKQMLDSMPFLIPGGTAIAIGSVVVLILLPKMAHIMQWLISVPRLKKILPEKVIAIIEKLAQQFEVGTKSLTDPKAYPAIALLTPMIWLCYFLNNYLLIWAFHLESRVSALQCLIVFAIGNFAVLVPTPGSAGSVHILVSNALVWTCGIDQDLALAYATVLHLFCFVIVVCIPAAFCWLWQTFGPKKQPA